jgi:hypothetical protein
MSPGTCSALIVNRLRSPHSNYGRLFYAVDMPKGTDLKVPHSELAMQVQAAGKKLVAWACRERECGVVFAEARNKAGFIKASAGCGFTFGIPIEVLPHDVRQVMKAKGVKGIYFDGSRRRRKRRR